MPKIRMKVGITNQNEKQTIQVSAIFQDDILKYKENDTRVILDYTKHILIRENDNYKMIFHFNDNQGTIITKENNISIDIPIKTNKIERKEKDIIIEYIIEEEKFLYQVEEEKWVY